MSDDNVPDPRGSGSQISDIIKKPTEEMEDYFIFENDPQISAKWGNKYDSKYAGKWMMFYPFSTLDEKWEEAIKNYRSGKLIGIDSMKVSTKKKNPRASDDSTGVIIFYCGPANDEKLVMSYGHNLLKYVPYINAYGFMYYKSDMQTLQGTRATGQKSNSKYKIPVPRK